MFAYVIHSVLCVVAETEEGVTSTKNSFRRTVQIDVRLNPMARIGRIFRRLGKAFQNEMVDVRPVKGVSYFGVGGFDRLKSLGVIGSIPFRLRTHPTRTMVIESLSERNC
jgi:hypothetical protein